MRLFAPIAFAFMSVSLSACFGALNLGGMKKDSSNDPTDNTTSTAPVASLANSLVTISNVVLAGTTYEIVLDLRSVSGEKIAGQTISLALKAGSQCTATHDNEFEYDSTDAIYRAEFTPQLIGTPCEWEFALGGDKLVSEDIAIFPGPLDPSRTSVEILGSVYKGEQLNAVIRTFDAFGNPLQGGGETWFLELDNDGTAEGNFSTVVDNGNGTYGFDFSARRTGTAASVLVRAGGPTGTPVSPAPAVVVTNPPIRATSGDHGGPPSSTNGIEDTSSDGRYGVFQRGVHVYVWDFVNRSETLISRNPVTLAVGNNTSKAPRISDDGRWIVFSSIASNLHASDVNNREDVYQYDRQNGTLSVLTTSEDFARTDTVGYGCTFPVWTEIYCDPNGSPGPSDLYDCNSNYSTTVAYGSCGRYEVGQAPGGWISEGVGCSVDVNRNYEVSYTEPRVYRHPDISGDGSVVVAERTDAVVQHLGDCAGVTHTFSKEVSSIVRLTAGVPEVIVAGVDSGFGYGGVSSSPFDNGATSYVWPAVSPDGTSVAYIRTDRTATGSDDYNGVFYVSDAYSTEGHVRNFSGGGSASVFLGYGVYAPSHTETGANYTYTTESGYYLTLRRPEIANHLVAFAAAAVFSANGPVEYPYSLYCDPSFATPGVPYAYPWGNYAAAGQIDAEYSSCQYQRSASAPYTLEYQSGVYLNPEQEWSYSRDTRITTIPKVTGTWSPAQAGYPLQLNENSSVSLPVLPLPRTLAIHPSERSILFDWSLPIAGADSNGAWDFYSFTHGSTPQLQSRTDAGVVGNNHSRHWGRFTEDGFIEFLSSASNLVSGVTPTGYQIFRVPFPR